MVTVPLEMRDQYSHCRLFLNVRNLISSLFALRENMPVVPGTSDNIEELVNEIKQINNQNNYLDMLAGISHPLLTKEFLYSWFDGFKNFDVNKLKNRKMLIDTFVNSVVLYDDRIDFYFNFKDNAKSLTLSELNTVSDLSSSSPP